jgi:predicted nuclease with TOPRIM domain
MEFWAALGRLYNESVALREEIVAMKEDTIAFRNGAAKLLDATEKLQAVAEGHEKRLDRLEVIQQWLAEKERKRELEGGR